jgi:3-phosphoshikimate 1-carboxyvinyltransferase
VKESDRIATVVEGLGGLGANIEATGDGFVVRGTGGLRGGVLDAHGDHRLAMLGAVAGLASREGVEVAGMEAAAVSYPRFEDDLRSVLVA